MSRTRTRLLAALALITGLLCLAGCPGDKEPIRLGLAINLSGKGGAAGELIRNCALIAVEDVNETGGVHGRSLELLVQDDRNEAEGVRRADRILLEQGVAAIIGHSTSQNTVTAYPLVTGAGTILFTPYAATSKLSGRDDLFFRTSVDNVVYGKAFARVLQKRRVERASVLMDVSNRAFVDDLLAQVRRFYSGTLHPVAIDGKSTIDWQAAVDGLLAAEPQAVLLFTEAVNTAFALQHLERAGYRGTRIGTLWCQAPRLFTLGGRAVEGFELITFIAPRYDTPQYQRLSRAYAQRYNAKPSARGVRAYEAIEIFRTALEHCPSPVRSACLKQAFLATEFQTIMGRVRFDANGDVDRPIYLLRIHDGGFQTEITWPPATF